MNKGNVLAQLARYEEAVESFDRALALKPGDADMLNNRGSALAALGRHEAALASFDQALRLLPESAEVLSNRAISLKASGGSTRRAGIANALWPDLPIMCGRW